MGAAQFREASPAQVADAVTGLGSAYAAYAPSIVSNAVGGDVLSSLDIEQLPMLFATLGVTNTIHQAKLRVMLQQNRPSLLQRTLSQARAMDMALNQSGVAKTFDCFLSHDWGVDGATHAKVGHVNAFLKARGIRTWFDQDQMTGNILQAMATGIERSILVLVFVTRRYMAKVNGSNPNDNCQLEFGMAKCTQTASHMVPVILDPTMKSVATWAGQLKMVLGNLLYVDLSADTADGFEQGCASLLQRVQTLLGRTHVTSSKAGDTYPAQLATEQLADVDEVAPTPVPTDRVATPVTSMYSFPWLLAWSEAMAGTDNEEVQEDSLVVVLEQLDATLASPQVDSFIQSFPYTTLITAMESPALAEVATQVCAILVDHPRAAASLAALPSFVPTLTSLLQANASATADAALVALTNITFAPPPDRAFTDALVPLLMQLPSRDHVVDVLVNVSAANRSSFLPYLDQLIAMLPSNDKLSPMWKIFLNLSVDAACTASLAALGFVDILWTTQLHTQDCELTMKLLLGLCRHGAGSSAVAMSSHWQVWLLETGRPSLTIASHLADQDSSDYLAPRANAWTSFWVDALLQHDDDERNVELALCSLVNVAAKDEIWRREIEVHVERAVWPWIIRRSRLQPMALKLVGNLIDMKLVRDLLTAKLQDGMAIDEGDEYARDLWHEIVATLA